MAWCSEAELAAAVSEAGGLGLIGVSTMSAEQAREQIKKTRTLTAKPVGVNLPLLKPDFREIVEVILKEEIKIVFTSAGNPQVVVPQLKKAGVIVVHVISNVRQARKAVDAGCDAVVAEGFEAGGHDGPDELTTLTLTPMVVDAVGKQVPVIAAGGIVDARGAVAAFALGADGIQIGTRFIATYENNAHQRLKDAIINADDTSTVFIARSYHPMRVLKNNLTRKIHESESKDSSGENIRDMVGPGRGYKAVIEGDLDEGLFNCGQGAGMIKSIVPAAEVIKEIVEGYKKIFNTLGDGF